jgi:hypothetical protein
MVQTDVQEGDTGIQVYWRGTPKTLSAGGGLGGGTADGSKNQTLNKEKKEKKSKKKEPAHAVAGSEAVEKSEVEKAAAEETQALDEEVASKPTATRKKMKIY